MLGFVHRLVLFYFPDWGPDKNRNREMARLIQRLKKGKNLGYDPMANAFLPPFTAAVLALQPLAEGLRPLYLRLFGPGNATRPQAVQALLWARLEKLGVTPQTFVFPGSPPPPANQTPEDWDQTFEANLAVLRTPQMTEAVRALEANLPASDLCQYNFETLRNHLVPPGRPVPGRAAADRVFQDLLDLYFLLPGTAFDRSAAEGFADLAAAAGFNGVPGGADLQKIGALVNASFEPDVLADVLRCIREDPALELRVAPPPPDLIGPLVRELTDSWNAARIEYLRVQAENEFQGRLAQLFGHLNLHTVVGYDAPTSALLVRCGLPAFRHLRPLRALKNFLVHFYLAKYRQALGGLFLELEFLDHRFKAGLITAVDAVDRTAGLLDQFEEDCQVFLKTRITPYTEVMEANLMARATKDGLKQAVEGFDLRADAMIQDAFGGLRRVSEGLTKVKDDWSSRVPEVVANAAYLTHHSPQLTKDLHEIIQRLGEIAGLMREVSVDVQAAKTLVGEGEAG